MKDLFHDILNYLKPYYANTSVNVTDFVKPYIIKDDKENTLRLFKVFDNLKSKNFIDIELTEGQSTSVTPVNKQGQEYVERNGQTIGRFTINASITNDGLTYLEHKGRDERQSELLERQTIISEQSGQSVISTNDFTRKNANRNILILWLTLIVAGAGAFATIKSCQIANQQNKQSKLIEQRDQSILTLKNKLTEKDEALSVQKKIIDSLLQTKAGTKQD
jgi:hypothetical protein